MKSKNKQITLGVIISLVVLFILGGLKACQISKAISEHESFKLPPSSVTAVTLKKELLPKTLKAVGTLRAESGSTLAAEVGGRVAAVHVESGATVKKGDLLIELDSNAEQSELTAARAQAQIANLSLARIEKLYKVQGVSQSELDQANATARALNAGVHRLESVIVRKKIVAPYAGKIGIRRANVGAYVNSGDAIISITKLTELFLNFSIPQRAVPYVSSAQELSLTVDGYPGTQFPGKITAIESQLNDTTRMLSVQALIPNPEEKLLPGMFAQLTITIGQPIEAILVPSSAIAFNSYGSTIFVIEPMKEPTGEEYLGARQQVIKTGETVGDLVEVTEGLSAGDQIVTSGAFRLRQGAPVVVNNSAIPSGSQAPQPENK